MIRRIVNWGIRLMIVCAAIVAHTQPANYGQLDAIYQKLPQSIKEKNGGMIYDCPIYIEGAINNIRDLGMQIMPTDSLSPINQFVNRKFLELALSKDPKEVVQILNQCKAELILNGEDFERGALWQLPQAYKIINKNEKLSILRDSLRYCLQWDKGKEYLRFTFPANIQIVSGKDKRELEHELSMIMRHAHSNSYQKNEAKEMVKKDKRIYYSKGNYLFIKEMSSNCYFTKDREKEFELIFSPDYLAESFSNLFLQPIETALKTTIVIEQQMYGNEKKKFNLSLDQFHNYLKTHHMETYVGIEVASKDSIDATIIMYNKDLNYYHMLYAKSTPELLFNSSKPTVMAKLYSYIPADNILTLYKEGYKSE